MKLLNKKQTAERLGVSIPTVDRAIKKGTIKAVKISARPLIPEAEIIRLLSAKKEVAK